MKKPVVLHWIWLGVLILAFLPAPATAGLVVSMQGDTILSRTGSSSFTLTITDTGISEDGKIIIDVSNLAYFVANSTFTDANNVINDTATGAAWTGQVDNEGSIFILNLTSAGGATLAGETVTVTFTGAVGGNSAWYYNTGDVQVDLTATRADTLETSDALNFRINVVPGAGGLGTTSGEPITTPEGSTAMILRVTDSPIQQNDLVTIPVYDLDKYVEGGRLTNDNIVISDDAAEATWAAVVDNDGMLTLTSENGETAIGENVTVIFTGTGGNPWKAGKSGNTLVTASRTDTYASADFAFTLNIPPPPGYNISASFNAAPTEGIAPLTVHFFDRSSGNPDAWDWDWWDGTKHGTRKNQSHTYMKPGIYPVSLTASNNYSSDTITLYRYITVYNGGICRTNTTISGLAVTGCGSSQQTISVNISVLPADLIPDNFVLEIQPPADRGLKNITIYAQNGIGFTRSGDIISGSPTRVQLESEDIAPPGGFSDTVGVNASFNYRFDLPYYPCNALITTTIREGILPDTRNKLQKIGSGQIPVAVPLDTAYTATITRTNLPPPSVVKIRSSVNSSWNRNVSSDVHIFTWWISDDGNAGQILPTTLRSSDTALNLDYYEAGSPHGMSTFGLSSFTGNNNPFQLITLTVASYIEQPQDPEEPLNDHDPTSTPTASLTPVPTPLHTRNATPASGQLPESRTTKLYTNTDGIVTQATTLLSPDGFLAISLDPGVAAKDPDGRPLTSLTLSRVSGNNLPGPVPGGTFFTGRAYELYPDGATFSPGIALRFAAPPDTKFGQEFSVMGFDTSSGTWQEVRSAYNISSGQVTAQVTHFCCFGLFTREMEAGTPVATPITTAQPAAPAAAPPSSAIGINAGMIQWATNLLAEYSLAVSVLVVVIGGVVLYEWNRRRAWK